MDWIDDEYTRRRSGINHPLPPSQHETVNARYPGCTLEYCCQCDAPTGRAGRADDSLFTDAGDGPHCEDCWNALNQGDK